MEVQYVKNENNREENFILPETEKAINGIIAEIGRTFSLSRVLLQIVYIAYLAMRTFYMERFFAFNVVLLTICILQLLFFFADLNGKKRISGKVDLPFRIAKRLVSLAVAGIFFMDIFVLSETVQRWQAVSGVLICLGWIMAFIGDLFFATVPRYTRIILNSFKKDIEPTALVSRGLEKAKEAAGHMAKRKAVRSWRNVKSWFSELIDN